MSIIPDKCNIRSAFQSNANVHVRLKSKKFICIVAVGCLDKTKLQYKCIVKVHTYLYTKCT